MFSSEEPARYQPQGGKWRLGRDVQTGEYVDAPQAGRREGLYIIGLPGTGKTGLIENLIIQDIKQGLGVGLLDPHGDLTQAVLARIPDRREQDVIYLDITDEDYPFGLNLFTCDDPTSAKAVQVVVDKVMHVFDKLFELSAATTPRLRQYLRNCTQTLIVNPGYTMADMPLLLLDEQCRKKLVANVTNTQVQGFWKTFNRMKPSEQLDHADSTLNKLDELLQPLTVNIVGHSTSSVDVRTIMDEGKILLVKLSAQLDSITSLIGSVLIALFLNAAYARPANKRRQFNLYADEFQRFATDDYATLLTEARKFGIATTIAHQARYQPGMTNGIRATSLGAKNLVVFKVNSKDGDELAGEFDITPQEAWEQELEKESFEPKTDWIEEEHEEDIKEISSSPVEFLISARGTHGSPTVRRVTQSILIPLSQAVGKELYSCFKFVPEFPPHFTRSQWAANWQAIEGRQILNTLLVDVMDKRLVVHTTEFAEQVEAIVTAEAPFIGWFGVFYHPIIQDEARRRPKRKLYIALSSFVKAVVTGNSQDGSLEELQEQLTDALTADLVGIRIAQEKILSPYLSKEDREREERYRKLLAEDIARWTPGAIIGLKTFIFELMALCEEVAKEPIMVTTGQKRVVTKKRQQLSYWTHPRKALAHPKRPYADVHNEVASELVNQDNFMARVRYINADQRNIECAIRTLDPKQDSDMRPLFGQALEDRIERIKERNMQDGHLRERTEVEAEIRHRQELCTEPSNEPHDAIYRRPQR